MTNISRLQDLRDQVWQYGPEHFDMDTWYAGPGTIQSCGEIADGLGGRIDINQCGTTGCLAGHGALVMLKNGYQNEQADWYTGPSVVCDYFGLPDGNVFYLGNWSWVVMSNGTALIGRYRAHGGNHIEDYCGDSNCDLCHEPHIEQEKINRHAQWSTIIEYLDDLIKNPTTDGG